MCCMSGWPGMKLAGPALKYMTIARTNTAAVTASEMYLIASSEPLENQGRTTSAHAAGRKTIRLRYNTGLFIGILSSGREVPHEADQREQDNSTKDDEHDVFPKLSRLGRAQREPCIPDP